MRAEPLFRSLEPAQTVCVTVDGQCLEVPAHASVAGALLAAGVHRFRATPVSAAPRAPYCMMGVCFDCLMEVDGIPSRQTCLLAVREGMVLRTQNGARQVPVCRPGEPHEH